MDDRLFIILEILYEMYRIENRVNDVIYPSFAIVLTTHGIKLLRPNSGFIFYERRLEIISLFFSFIFSGFLFISIKKMAIGFGSKDKKNNSKALDEEPPSENDVDKLSVKNLEEKSQFKEFKEFLKVVISFTGDLSSLTCPAFFLNGLSLLEYG